MPEKVKVTDIHKTSVTVEWSAPVSDGGARVSRYYVWQRLETVTEWSKMASCDRFKNAYTIKNLEYEKTYVFGVSAENEVGQSDTAESKPVALEKPLGE